MTLREAIEHCESLAESCKGSLCGEQHKQLAEWLRDYERLKELPCIAVDEYGFSIIAQELFPFPPLACKGNGNGWTMYDKDDENEVSKIPQNKDLLIQTWDDEIGIDSFNGRYWNDFAGLVACWRELP